MSSGVLLILGIVVLLLGLAMVAGWFDWVLDVGGVILIIIGIAVGVFGVVGMVSGRNSGGGRY